MESAFLFVLVPTDPKDLQFLIVFQCGVYGLSVLRAVLGEEAIFYGAFFNIPFNILATHRHGFASVTAGQTLQEGNAL